MIVAPRTRLISKEVNLIILTLKESEAKSLVPTLRKNIKTDLTSDRISKIKVCKLLFESCYEVFSYVVFLVIDFKSVSFLSRAVSPNRGDVEHS